MPVFFQILAAALAESVVSFSGAALAIFNVEKIKRATHFIVSFAVGALLGVSFLDLIPEAIGMSSAEAVLPLVLAGIILFFVSEKLLFWYHCHEGECPVHTYTYLILWGDFLHNFIDGVILALAFIVDTKIGIVTTIAVILHEIPQEIGDFGILMHGGFSKRKAIFYNFMVSLSTLVGAVITYVLAGAIEPFLPLAIALVAGNFIYLASVDLMPELHEATGLAHSFLQVALILAGILLVIAPGFFF